MYKTTVTYKDFDDVEQSDTLYFYINRDNAVDLLPLKNKMEEWAKKTERGGNRDLTSEEVRDLYHLIKTIVRHAYGVRTDGGKRFRKSKKIWTKFEESAVFDTFMFSLFDPPENALKFMQNVLPKDLEKYIQEAEVVQLPGTEGSSVSVDKKETVRKYDDYSDEELLAMPDDEWTRLVGKNPKGWNRDQLEMAFRRKSR